MRPPLASEQADKSAIERGFAGLGPQLGGSACADHLALVHRHQPIEATSFFHVAVATSALMPVSGHEIYRSTPRTGGVRADRRRSLISESANQDRQIAHNTGQPASCRPESFAAGRSRKGLKPVLASNAAMRSSRCFALPEESTKKVHVFQRLRASGKDFCQTRHVGDARLYAGAKTSLADVAAEHFDLAGLYLARPGN